MELLTVIKCLAARGCGGARLNPSNYQCTFFMCVVYSSWAAPIMHCVHHHSAKGFAL